MGPVVAADTGIELEYERDFAALSQATVVLAIDHGRAGNGFFKRIFDCHPQVATIPAVSYMYHSLEALFGAADRVPWQAAVTSWEQTDFSYVGRALTDERRRAYVARGNEDRDGIDRERVGRIFTSLLQARGTVTRRDVVLATHVAYARGIGRASTGITQILLDDAVTGVEDRFVLERLMTDFPSARVIHLVRDPRASFSSLRHQIVNQYGSMYPLKAWRFWRATGSNALWLWILKYTADGAREMEAWGRLLTTDQFYRVRNEDLNLDFVPTLRRLSSWLGVDWWPAWEAPQWVPTTAGVPWAGVSAYSGEFKPGLNGPLQNDRPEVSRYPGPNRRNTERWKEHVSTGELAVLETVYAAELHDLGYRPLAPRHGARWFWAVLRPLGGEVPGWSWLTSIRPDHALKDLIIRATYYPLLPASYVWSRLMFLLLLASGRLRCRDL